MKAIILAAGRGTRVRPITTTVPKPMIPILHKPVMEILVQLLESHGVRQIMVNTSYLATEIEGYFRDGSRFGVEMAYSFEGRLENGRFIDEPVGSAGALKKIQEHSGFFDETCVVLCGDAVIDVDLTRLIRFHRKRGAAATLALTSVARDRVSNYGVVVTDKEGRVLEFQEKPDVDQARSTTVNTGIYVFEPEVIGRIPSGVTYDIGGQLFPDLVREKAPLYGAQVPFQWLDIGRVSDYYDVIQMALRGEVNGLSVPGTQVSEGVWVGINVRFDPSRCRIEPPVYVGGSATIEPGCSIIGPTMIGPGCVVESGAYIEKSVVFDYTRIGFCARVRNVMICGDYCVDPSGTVINLAQSDIDWAVADARSPKKALTSEQQQFLEMLQQGRAIEKRPRRAVYAA
ncbi:MAG: mannose-1-phosphate guanyltransferase [Candidatus Handelsmanbacteria bacterium RIFCSPLOWO2_12_FULL_64_10]|uniref:Mannose-1-phosphate guanyltransferase n=1 Tax=Handelsmanbacteria sp. (strain RIFCSPLOWO2_12_FULL_64_10) TaxID=1817868 RepID=A0A1F6C631_HANXR|nr:MAG: mannose-1-phosphate guanyltransferase [Candidatus Handelsmanbacteria bacterium RIFCSPLOWO2_12_FULL_64_10]